VDELAEEESEEDEAAEGDLDFLGVAIDVILPRSNISEASGSTILATAVAFSRTFFNGTFACTEASRASGVTCGDAAALSAPVSCLSHAVPELDVLEALSEVDELAEEESEEDEAAEGDLDVLGVALEVVLPRLNTSEASGSGFTSLATALAFS